MRVNRNIGQAKQFTVNRYDANQKNDCKEIFLTLSQREVLESSRKQITTSMNMLCNIAKERNLKGEIELFSELKKYISSGQRCFPKIYNVNNTLFKMDKKMYLERCQDELVQPRQLAYQNRAELSDYINELKIDKMDLSCATFIRETNGIMMMYCDKIVNGFDKYINGIEEHVPGNLYYDVEKRTDTIIMFVKKYMKEVRKIHKQIHGVKCDSKEEAEAQMKKIDSIISNFVYGMKSM